MNRNTVVGFVLIFLVLIVYSVWQGREAERIEAQSRQVRDSLAQVYADSMERVIADSLANVKPDTTSADIVVIEEDKKVERTGAFAHLFEGEDKIYSIENELIKVDISSRGGDVSQVTVKGFKRFGTEDAVQLFHEGENNLGLVMGLADRGRVSTDSMYMEVVGSSFKVEGSDSQTIAFRAMVDSQSYIEHSYTLGGKSNFVRYSLNLVGMDDLLDRRQSQLWLEWAGKLNKQERSASRERSYTTVYYGEQSGDVDYISEGKDVENEDIRARLRWVSFKQQFFNSTLIYDKGFEHAKITTRTPDEESPYLKELAVRSFLKYKGDPKESYDFRYYFGQNGYKNLKQYDLGMEDMVPLGVSILGLVNKGLVLPVFNFFERFTTNYGLIILLLAIFIKLLLSPLTWKSYKSQAKMRVIKPEVDALREKMKDNQQAFQMEQMKLYRQNGVSMFGGCLPMLLQFPIILAMYQFFPGAINLRQKGFLWADDFSTYDSIFEFGYVPLIGDFYGEHISLFTLLMAVSSFFYSRMNSQMTSMGGGGPMAAQMKIMQYIFPFMLVFIFNSFASGLTYYYLLYNVLSFVQQWIFKTFFIDEKKIRAQMEQRRLKKKGKKKGGWMERKMQELEKARKEQAKKGRRR